MTLHSHRAASTMPFTLCKKKIRNANLTMLREGRDTLEEEGDGIHGRKLDEREMP